MEQKTYIHKKICLCRNCQGTGIEITYREKDLLKREPIRQRCPQCNGSGRVIVYGERTLKIVPYEPGKPTDTNVTV